MSGKLAPSIVGVIHTLVQFVHGAERVYSHRAEALPPSLARLLISAYDVVFSKIWLKTDSSVSTDNQRPKFK